MYNGKKNMQFKQSRLPESFQKYITKEKGYLLCILKIIFYHLIFLAVYQNRLAKSIFFLKKNKAKFKWPFIFVYKIFGLC